MNKRKIGAEKELLAEKFLCQKGIRILYKNFRTRYGEIDIIGTEQDVLVFLEVKYRNSADKGSPLEAVTYQKQRKICKVADYYRMCYGIHDYWKIRFDVIGILGDEITWIKDAFPYRR